MKRHRELFLAVAACGLIASGAPADEDHRAVPAAATSANQAAASDSIQYAARILNGNKVGLTLTNYGFIGTNFSSFAPSFE